MSKTAIYVITENGRMKVKSTSLVDAIKEINSTPYYTYIKPKYLTVESKERIEWKDEWSK